jgi:hypothetical protein
MFEVNIFLQIHFEFTKNTLLRINTTINATKSVIKKPKFSPLFPPALGEGIRFRIHY